MPWPGTSDYAPPGTHSATRKQAGPSTLYMQMPPDIGTPHILLYIELVSLSPLLLTLLHLLVGRQTKLGKSVRKVEKRGFHVLAALCTRDEIT
jgi:hypothetical protein